MDSITKPVLSTEQLSLICEKHLGDRCASAQELKDGWFNAAYLLTTSGGQEAVLKVAPPDAIRLLRYERNLMRAEVSAMQLVATRTNLPMPKVLAHDVSRQEVDSDYFLAERLSGTPLNLVRAELDIEIQNNVETEIGRFLAELHTLSGVGFGVYNGPLDSTWPEAFDRLIEWLRQDAEDKSVELPAGAFEVVEPHRWSLAEVKQPCLVHWDLWDGNIFVDPKTGKITGLIDFERAMWADPLIEQNFRDVNPALLESYGASILASAGSRSRRLLYDLHLFLIMVIECRYRQLPFEHESWCRAQLDEVLTRARTYNARS